MVKKGARTPQGGSHVVKVPNRPTQADPEGNRAERRKAAKEERKNK